MNFRHIIFDLDGTLVNSYYGITNSVKYALEGMDRVAEEREKLRKFIGPPLVHTFMKDYDMTREEGDRAVALYREYYTDKGINECELFPGIKELLEYLEKNGADMYIATSKPQKFTEAIIKNLGIDKYFRFVRGVSFSEAEAEKDFLIEDIIEKFGLDKKDAVMIGDTKFDIEAANRVGVTSVGVLYGFGGKEQLKESDIIVKEVSELKNIL